MEALHALSGLVDLTNQSSEAGFRGLLRTLPRWGENKYPYRVYDLYCLEKAQSHGLVRFTIAYLMVKT